LTTLRRLLKASGCPLQLRVCARRSGLDRRPRRARSGRRASTPGSPGRVGQFRRQYRSL